MAELALPLVNQDRLVGVLNIEGPALEPFTPAARTALQVLASHLAVAIENATLYSETRWYADLLGTLNEIGKETSSILDLDLLLQRLAEIVRRVVDFETFGVLLLDEERQELVLQQGGQLRRGPGAQPDQGQRGAVRGGGALAPAGARGRRARRRRATSAWWRRRARSWSCR